MNLIDNSISEQLAINSKFTIYEQRRGAEIEKKEMWMTNVRFDKMRQSVVYKMLNQYYWL